MVSSTPVIRTDKLNKFYGRHRGIVDVSLEVDAGEVFGFLGPNGAGKTTTLRILMDLIRPTRGSAEVFGLHPRDRGPEIRARTGYLPGELVLYEHMRGEDHLRFLANLRGLDGSDVGELAERLGADLSRKVGELSKGNKQKIGLIQAFMGKRELLILDEPSAGLDPLVQHEVHALVSDASRQGRTVFLSSHNLPEVEALCHRVAIIREGRLLAVEQIATLKERALRRLEIHFGSSVSATEFEGLPGVRDVVSRDGVLRCTVVGDIDAVIKAATRYKVVNVVSHEPSLEEIFLAFYEDSDDP
ncbi:MAG: ATP-binding cassette domain-containing protein [Actinomycetota bacterium]